MKLWIVLPAMNEEKTLPKLLDSIFREFSTKDYGVIVINDGSTDRTGSVAESFQDKGHVIVLHNDGNKGLGFTILRGLREAADTSCPVNSSKCLLLRCGAFPPTLRK